MVTLASIHISSDIEKERKNKKIVNIHTLSKWKTTEKII